MQNEEKLSKNNRLLIDKPEYNRFEDIDSVFPYLKANKPKLEEVKAFLAIADTLQNYNASTALVYAEEANFLAKRYDEDFLLAQSHYWLALLKNKVGFLDENSFEALTDAKVALERFENENDDYWIANTLTLMGIVYMKMGQDSFPAGYSALNRAALLIEEGNIGEDKALKLKSEVFHTLGLLHGLDGEVQKAKNNFDDALRILETLDDKAGLGRVYLSVGNALIGQEEYVDAKKYFERSLSLGKRLEDNDLTARALGYLGNFNFYMARAKNKEEVPFYTQLFEESISYFHEQEGHLIFSKKQAWFNLGIAYVYRKYFEKEERYVDSALKYYNMAYVEAGNKGDLNLVNQIEPQLSNICKNNPEKCESSSSSYYKTQSTTYNRLINARVDHQSKANRRLLIEFDGIAKEERNKLTQYLLIVGLVSVFSILILLIQTLRSRNKNLKSRMATLRAQINPHFIANTINAIDGLILKDDTETASNYLADFTRFTRSILNGSVDGNISLAKRITMLESYLKLMKLRYGSKLYTQITVDPEINEEFVWLPPW